MQQKQPTKVKSLFKKESFEDFHTFNNISFQTEINNTNPNEKMVFSQNFIDNRETNAHPINNQDKSNSFFLETIQTSRLIDDQTITYTNGSEYKGQTLNGKRNGKGTFIYIEQNLSYDGEWKNDLFHGEGKLTDNGYCYKGKFLEGKKEGKGEVIHDKSDYYFNGIWKDDLKNGYGKKIVFM